MRSILIAAFVSLVLAMLLVQDIPLNQYLTSVEHAQVLTQIERDSWQLASENDTALETGDLSKVERVIKAYANRTGAEVTVTDAKGVVLAASQSQAVGKNLSGKSDVSSALRKTAAASNENSAESGNYLLYYTVPVDAGGATIGVIRIGYPESEINKVIDERVRTLVLFGAISILLTYIAAFLLATAMTRRLVRLQKATAELEAGDLSVRVSDPDDRGVPEISHLEKAFDSMVERLTNVLESQRSFASDASHQLRTPLTALRLQLENATELIDKPEAMEAVLEAASEEVIRLQSLVDGLLALARIEGSAVPLSEVNVTELLHRRVEMWRPLATERDVALVPRIATGLRVMATPGAIDQIVDVYLDNALEFAPTRSSVRLTAEVEGNEVVITVADSGPGMSDEEIARAFDRFWRGRTDGSGAGLGLAIVSRLAASIHATVGLTPGRNRGLNAWLRLPRA